MMNWEQLIRLCTTVSYMCSPLFYSNCDQLISACRDKNVPLSAIKVLLVEYDVNYWNWDGQTALSAAVQHNRADIVHLLRSNRPDLDINEVDSTGMSVLMDAATHNAADAALALLAEHDLAAVIDVNQKTHHSGNTALMLWAGRANTAAVEALFARSDLDVNEKSKRGETALMWAIASRRIDIIALFVSDRRVDINVAIDVGGETALIKAAIMGDVDIVRLLLTRPDLDVFAKDSDVWGLDALMWATRMKQTATAKVLFDVMYPPVVAQLFEHAIDTAIDTSELVRTTIQYLF